MTTTADWTGRVGQTWAAEWQRTDRSLADLARHLDVAVLAAAPDASFRAIDIGCGAGSTSLSLATSRPDAQVVGVDLSPELLAVAVTRGAARPNLTFRRGDASVAAQELAPIDLFVSRHGVMFFADPAAVFADLHDVAASDARLVFSCFRDRADNPWASDLVEQVTGSRPPIASGYTPGPFAFADPAHTAAILETAGWSVDSYARVDFTYVAGAGEDPVDDAVAFFRRIGPLASAFKTAADPAAATARLKVALERYSTGSSVAFPASAWIWRARAAKGRGA